MSQFQQPQDNRYIRPGVLDLGTGRQFDRLSVSTRGEGNIGTGAQGGGFVQGQSRVGTGLSGVDPLAQILGTVSKSVDNFMRADKLMAEAVDNQRNKELDKLEEQLQNAIALGEDSPEKMAEDHRNRVDEYYRKTGKLPKRGTSRKRFGEIRTKAEQSVRNFEFGNEFNEHLDKMSTFAGRTEDEIPEILSFRARYEGGPHEEKAIELTQQALNSAQARSQQAEDRDNARILANRFDQQLVTDKIISYENGKQVINVEKIISMASSGPNAFDLSDPDAIDKLGAMFISSIDISDMDQRSQDIYLREFSKFFAIRGREFIPAARQHLQELDRREQRIQHQAEWKESLLSGVVAPPTSTNPFVNLTNYLQSTATAFATLTPQAQEADRLDKMAAFMVTGTSRYDALPLDQRQKDDPSQRVMKIMGYLLQDSIDIADDLENPEDALQVMADARKAMPRTLDEAIMTGLIPLVDGQPPKGMDETTWNSLRKNMDQTMRAEQAKHIKPVFERGVEQATITGDFMQLGRLNNQLILLSGEADLGLAGPYGMLEDGNSIEILPVSQAGREFSDLALSLHRANNKMKGNISSSSRTHNMLKFGFDAEQGDQSSYVSIQEISDSPVMRATGKSMSDYLKANPDDVSGALAAVSGTINSIDYDPNNPINAFDETRAVIAALEQTSDVPATVAQAMVDAAMVVGYARTRGTENGDASIVVNSDLTGRIMSAMGSSNSSALTGENGIFIGTLYEALGTNPQIRKKVFGEHLDRAELTSNLIKRTGVTFDPEKYNWSGAIDIPVLERQQAVKGFDNLDDLASSSDQGYLSIADKVLKVALDPVGELSMPDGIPSELQEGLLAMHANVDEHMQTIRKQYGIPEEMTMGSFLSLVAPEIIDDLQITVASAFGDQNQYQQMMSDPKKMASVLSVGLEDAIQRSLAGKTVMGLQPYSDPEGSLAHLVREVGQENANPAAIADRVFDTSIHDSALGAGHEYVLGNEQVIYEKVFTDSFPNLLGDTPFQQVWEIASTGKNPEDVSFFDLVKAKLVDVDGAPIRITQQELNKTQIETLSDGSIEMTFPSIGQTLRYRPYRSLNDMDFAPLGRDTDPTRILGPVKTLDPTRAFEAAVMRSPVFGIRAANIQAQEEANKKIIEKYDTNGDGKLTGAERDAVRRDRNQAKRGG